MTTGEIIAVIGAIGSAGIIPSAFAGYRLLRKERQDAQASLEARIRSQVQAEFYKIESERTIEAKNQELSMLRAADADKARQLHQLMDVEWPRLRAQLDTAHETIANLSRQLGQV